MKKLALFLGVSVLSGCVVTVRETPRPVVKPPGVAVPSVVGISLAEANSALRALGLSPGDPQYVYSPGSEGKVVAQEPQAGRRVAAGSWIRLSVGSTPPAPTAVLVPQVMGLKLEDARRAVEESGLKMGKVDFFSSPVAQDRVVVSQSPRGGTSVAQGSQVSLRVSLRQESVAVPNCLGKSLAEASAAVVAAGLTIGGIESVEVPGVAAGKVAQQRPAAGSTARPGSAVSLGVATGAMMTVVPDLIGSALSQATRMLTAAGLSVAGVSSAASEKPERTVIRQSLQAGSMARRGTGVSLTIAAAPRQVAVPPVVGLGLPRAEQILRASSLNPGQALRMPARERRDTVIAQAPEAGVLVIEGSEVALTVSSGAAQVAAIVPHVVGMTQAEAEGVLAAAGLATGNVTTRPAANPGRVISQSLPAGSRVVGGTAVDMVVATAARLAVVPNVVGTRRQIALRTVSAAGLTAQVALAAGRRDVVLSQDPAAGTRAAAGSAMSLTVGSGAVQPTVTIPNVVGMNRNAAEAQLRRVGLVAGEVTTQPGGRKDFVASQDPAAGTTVAGGSAVKLTVWAGAVQPTVTVPNVVGRNRNAAEAQLKRVGLVVGAVSTRPGGRKDFVASQDPAAGTTVAGGSAVKLTVWSGAAQQTVTVPNVIGAQRGAAEARLRAAGLVVGAVSTRPGGRKGVVATQDPAAGAVVPRGSQVSLVLWSGAAGPPANVGVPNVVGQALAAAQTAVRGAGLVVGKVERRPGGRPGIVTEQSPMGGTQVRTGSRVDLVVGAEATGTPVPQLVGMNLNQAQARLGQAGLAVGQVTRRAGGKKDVVASQSPAAGTLAAPGSKVDLEVYSGPAGGKTVPSVVGKSIPEAQRILREAGYKAQVRRVNWGKKNVVENQNPRAGTAAGEGATVVIYVGR